MKKRNPKSKDDIISGVAPVVGFLLILAIVFVAAAQYQANVVPEEEEQEESDHFSQVTQQLNGLRTEILRTAATGNPQTQNIQTGVDYSVIGVNSPPVPGVFLHLDSANPIEIRNATNNDVASNFWRADAPREYETGYISYRADYNRFQQAGEIYIEHGFVYRDTQPGVTPKEAENNSDIPLRVIEESDQPIIDGNTITLYVLRDGLEQQNLTSSGISQTVVELEPASAPMNTLSITDEGDPITIQLPTRLSANQWKEIFGDEMESQGGNIVNVSNVRNKSLVNISLLKGKTYNLRMARIDIQTVQQRAPFESPEPQYVAVENPVVNLREQSTINLEAEVRDKYNNGLSGETVYVEARETSSGECIGDFRQTSGTSPLCINSNRNANQPGSDVSDDDGDVRYIYDAPEVENDKQATFVYRIIN